MDGLLREVYDRLGEVDAGVDCEYDPQDPKRKLMRLRFLVGEVLDDGLFIGRLTKGDLLQLPGVI